MEFKDRIKQLREERELSPSQLGAAMDKSEGAVRSWETGKAYCDTATLIKLAEYFQCSSDYLLGLSDFKNLEQQKGFEAGWDKFFASLNKASDRDRQAIYGANMQFINLIEPNTRLSSFFLENLTLLIDNIILAASFSDNSGEMTHIEFTAPPGRAITSGNEAIQLLCLGIKSDSEKYLSLIWTELSEVIDKLYPVDLPDKNSIINRKRSY